MRNYVRMSLVALIVAANSAAADQLGAYYMELGPEDYRNSRGQPLTDPGAILQQDRANIHRFGIAHSGDEADPFFGAREVRAQIPALFQAGRPDTWALSVLRGPYPGYNSSYLVFICGSAGRITHIWVDPADGDGYTGCR